MLKLSDIVRRPAVGERHGGNAGKRLDAALQLVPEDDTRTLRILRRGQLDRAGEHVAGVEPEIDASELVQADEEQAGDDEQRRRDCELAGDQRASQPPDRRLPVAERPIDRSASSTGPPVPCSCSCVVA